MNARIPAQTCRGVDLEQALAFARLLDEAEEAWVDADGRYRAGFADEAGRDVAQQEVVADLAAGLAELGGLPFSAAWTVARLLLASKVVPR